MREEAPVVLYVDDEPINLRVFETNFRDRFRVLTCQSGQEAVELLGQKAPEIAAVITDQRMPGMTGVELLEKARVLAPEARRMLITAYSEMQVVLDAVNRGEVVRYFVKPWVKEELAAALEDAVGIHRLQAQLREIQARVLKSERLAALGQVSAGIAHELMNPVSYMTQNVSTLRREFGLLRDHIQSRTGAAPPQEVAQSLDDLPSILDDVETGAKHIRQIALGLRSQARGEDEEKVARLEAVVDFAVKIARAEVRHQARIVVKGDPVQVAVGPTALCQVLINLIVNAAQAMPAEGAGTIAVGWSVEDRTVHLDVTDTGTGIPEELQAKVFEPLFTTKPVGTGTGLGLPICKEIVERAGGRIRLASKVGQGTTVSLTLPLG